MKAKVKQFATFPALAIGDEVFCMLDEKSGEKRSTLVGAARCRVLAVSVAGIDLEILTASPKWIVGRKITKPRFGVYLTRDRAESAAFGRLVGKFWGQPTDHFTRSL